MIQVERTLNTGLCLDILLTPEIFDSISEDSSTIEHVRVDVIKDLWLGVYVDDFAIGCMALISKTSCLYELHIHILPEYRKEHSHNAFSETLEWCKRELPGMTLTTQVPRMCQNVIRFLEKFDFKNCGHIPQAYIKNKERYDLIILARGV